MSSSHEMRAAGVDARSITGRRESGRAGERGHAAPVTTSDSRLPSPGAKPWYREPWPWLLMAGPATVVVAGAVTVWLAIVSADGLVADDYYKRGLAINRELDRDRGAMARGISADVEVKGGTLRVRLHGAVEPDVLFARLVHATRAGYDQRVRLPRVGPRSYETALPELIAGRWSLILEDAGGEWRIVKEAL